MNDSTDFAGITLSAELYIYSWGHFGCFDDKSSMTSDNLLLKRIC
jgi:hypothetical protein